MQLCIQAGEQCGTGLLQASRLLQGSGCCTQAARGSGQLFQEYVATPQKLLALTDAELRSFHTAIACHIYNQLMGGDKVRDHVHIVGNYQGDARGRWNLVHQLSPIHFSESGQSREDPRS